MLRKRNILFIFNANKYYVYAIHLWGLKMDKRFVVITEIFVDGIKVSRRREEKDKINKTERNQLIKTYDNIYRNEKMKAMDIYSKISITLKEIYNIILSERSIMRVLKKD